MEWDEIEQARYENLITEQVRLYLLTQALTLPFHSTYMSVGLHRSLKVFADKAAGGMA